MSQSDLLPDAVVADMESRNIDIELSLEILDRYNKGEFAGIEPIRVKGIPSVDGTTVVDFTDNPKLKIARDSAADRVAGLVPTSLVREFGKTIGHLDGEMIEFSRTDLETVGLALFPRVSYGVLNGGSATSYADRSRNAAFSEELLDLLSSQFEQLSGLSTGRAKGLTPAFLQPDGTPGPSFLQLKMRGLLALGMKSSDVLSRFESEDTGELPSPLLPFFEMTSIHTNEDLRSEYVEYRSEEILADLIAHTGLDPTDPLTAVQPMISAYTHSNQGEPKRVFTRAYGRENQTIALPGGHGQSFSVLKSIYGKLKEMGKRFVYIGNVDNLGYLPDPAEVAYLALSGKQAGFDFAFKTAVDVKGGILVRDQRERLNCADIGPAVSPQDVAKEEASGKSILFNAATGLFDLDYLLQNLDRIIRDLPTRFTDQNKDAGEYSQAEQVTWEVIGMLDDFLVFSVEKWDRLLAAKLLSETLMTSGVALDDERYPHSDNPSEDLRGTARKLHDGLTTKLVNDYKMQLLNGAWVPVPATEIVGGGAR